MRVFVPGDGGAQRAVRAGRRRARAGPPPASERADARGRVRARGGRAVIDPRRRSVARMPIHDQGYRRYGGDKAPRGRALDGDRRAPASGRCSRKRRSSACCWSSWLPFFVRAVQIYAAANSAAGGVPRADAGDVPPVPRAAGDLRVLHHGLRRRRADRQRSPRQRAADLSVEAADARRVRLRQARDPDDVPAAGHLGAGDRAADRADRRSPATSRFFTQQRVSVSGDHACSRSSRS